MSAAPRVALFADSLLEVNGVALTCRKLEEHAQRKGLPLLTVHAGPETRFSEEEGRKRLSLKTSPVHASLENDLKFDWLFARHAGRVIEALRAYQAELVHVTGPNHTGFLGSIAAWRLKLPVVMSWHTNVHEYAACRLPGAAPAWLTRFPILGSPPRRFFQGLEKRREMKRARNAPHFRALHFFAAAAGVDRRRCAEIARWKKSSRAGGIAATERRRTAPP